MRPSWAERMWISQSIQAESKTQCAQLLGDLAAEHHRRRRHEALHDDLLER